MKTQIPSIEIVYGIDGEVNLFYGFLHHKFFPQHRNLIFQAFPELDLLLKGKNQEEEKVLIKDFISDFRLNNQEIINKIFSESKELLKLKFDEALSELANLMDYSWHNNFPGYTAMLTILPFSPFGSNIFYYSILASVRGKQQGNIEWNILKVAIHEISHMIFFNKLEKQYENTPMDIGVFSCRNNKKPVKEILDEVTLYDLKEILTPILMNQKNLKETLKLEDGYWGNNNIFYLYVQTSTNEKIQITQYFQQVFERLKYIDNKNFDQIINILIKQFLLIEDDLKKKNQFWNKYGNDIMKNEKLKADYTQPILITK